MSLLHILPKLLNTSIKTQHDMDSDISTEIDKHTDRKVWF